jgi:hypothetical protein
LIELVSLIEPVSLIELVEITVGCGSTTGWRLDHRVGASATGAPTPAGRPVDRG